MQTKTPNGWNIIINGENCPPDDNIVVAVWVQGSETEAELAYYEKEPKEWYSANPGSKGDPMIEPDYWIEFPN